MATDALKVPFRTLSARRVPFRTSRAQVPDVSGVPFGVLNLNPPMLFPGGLPTRKARRAKPACGPSAQRPPREGRSASEGRVRDMARCLEGTLQGVERLEGHPQGIAAVPKAPFTGTPPCGWARALRARRPRSGPDQAPPSTRQETTARPSADRRSTTRTRDITPAPNAPYAIDDRRGHEPLDTKPQVTRRSDLAETSMEPLQDIEHPASSEHRPCPEPSSRQTLHRTAPRGCRAAPAKQARPIPTRRTMRGHRQAHRWIQAERPEGALQDTAPSARTTEPDPKKAADLRKQTFPSPIQNMTKTPTHPGGGPDAILSAGTDRGGRVDLACG
jgi:hypothetical protein